MAPPFVSQSRVCWSTTGYTFTIHFSSLSSSLSLNLAQILYLNPYSLLMSSNYSSTCSKSYYPLCSLKCRACSGRCPPSTRRFNGGSSERSRRPDLPSMWSSGLSWRRAGSVCGRWEEFLLGQEGEKPTWDWSGRGNIMCSHTTLVNVTTSTIGSNICVVSCNTSFIML